MFGLIDSFSFIWYLNDIHFLRQSEISSWKQTEDCDKEVEELSSYDEGTDEGPSASKASNSAYLREWESDHDISSDSSLEILDVKPAFKYQKVQHVGSDSSDSESKESIEENSQISKNPFKE